MADLIREGMERLADLRESFAAVNITYRRGGSSATVKATIGKTDFRVVDVEGNYVRVTERDYLIKAAALVLSGSPITPQRGDLIDVSVGEAVYRYEVHTLPGEQVYRPSDPAGVTLRIHTKLKGPLP